MNAVAKLPPGVQVRVSKDGKSGYILRGQMWGTYAREKIEG